MDGLESVLPGLGGFGAFAAVLIVLIKFLTTDRRLLAEADTRYKTEVADHEATQRALDEERALRRKAEDNTAALAREVHGLKDQIEQLKHELAALRGQIRP